MDAKKTGSLIALLRREQRMTQKELADILYISGSIKVRFFSRGMEYCIGIVIIMDYLINEFRRKL